jgi:hypothetical protein
VALVITGGPSATVIVSGLLSEPEPLVAVIVALNVPGEVGVPEMRPVDGFTVTPGGNPVAPKTLTPLVAVIW